MEKIFHRARQNRIFQDVVHQIQNAILDGQIEAGNKLPPERELCDLFKTSRGTLREALRILEQKGLIEIRLGVNGGAYVRDANAELMAENFAMLIRSGSVSLDHLAEFREGVEGAVTGLAAQRATPTDVQNLRELLQQAETYTDQGISKWNPFVKVDEKIHMVIAQIAGNPLYIFILRTIHDNIHRYYDKFLTVSDDEMGENYEDLRLIVEAIERNEVIPAIRQAREHVRRFNRYMEDKKRLKALTDDFKHEEDR